MRRFLPILVLLLVSTGVVRAHGLLIPEEKTLPPLAMLNHKVTINIEDQVAITKVEQTFRNHTDRELEATYIFPVPKGASVNNFSMWVNGQEVKGELVPADKAREIYTSIVRRTQDPGLLEYMGTNLLRMRVFPIPRKGDQKVAMSFTAVAPKEKDLVEYIYPLKTDGKATATLEDFSIAAIIKSQHGVQNVYSPTHAITLNRVNNNEVKVQFDRNQGLLDKDFQLFYSLGQKDVGLTALVHRPISKENGYFMMLISPKVEISQEQIVPRDMVFVIDTSGSMRGVKMDQAKKALKYCVNNLNPKDRFALVQFATSVNTYKTGLLEASKEQVGEALKWIDKLDANGGTAINDALLEALELRSKDESRIFNVVFFTDGQPTIGENKPEKILKNVAGKNTSGARIFTFGVGYGAGDHDKLNASLLDAVADQSRAVSTYVRPEEDIEAKVSGMVSKISNPVLANLKLTVTNDMDITDIYPPQLPDLFHGGELVVFGRYAGKGSAAIKLTGYVGKEKKEFVYETGFAEKTDDKHAFVEHLWARRKVGYLLDQVRMNGEQKELVDEIVVLAKRYGITTPFTSFLIVPDSAVPVVGAKPVMQGGGFGGGGPGFVPPGLAKEDKNAKPTSVNDFARRVQEHAGDAEKNRGRFEDERLNREIAKGTGSGSASADGKRLEEAKAKKDLNDLALKALQERDYRQTQSGKLGVDLSVYSNNLRCQNRLEQTAVKNIQGRNCLEIGGVWIDEGYHAKVKTVTVKAQSDAYFRILEKKPEMKEVFKLGNHLVWMAPNGVALVIDTTEGQEKIEDKEIEDLFVTKK